MVASDPARAFAPLFHLHNEETRFPISAQRFVDRATLKWMQESCGLFESVATGVIADAKTIPGVPRLHARQLAGDSGLARRPLGEDCRRPVGRPYRVSEVTAPFAPASQRASELPTATGFYLDLLSDALDGDNRVAVERGQAVLRGIPVYFSTEAIRRPGGPGLQIDYWLLFGAHEAVTLGSETLEHEGDWEQVRVRVLKRGNSEWLPLSVSFGANGANISWRDVETAGSHPVVYLARGDHEPRPGPGEVRAKAAGRDGVLTVLKQTRACADCPVWRAWRYLRRLEAEPWYGFGGGWGLAWRAAPTSGPVGPRASSATR